MMLTPLPPPPGGADPPKPRAPLPPPLSPPPGGDQPTGRDSFGRFAAGNPGRRPGVWHSATMAVECLMAGEVHGLTRAAINAALRGDVGALRLCLGQIAPPPRSRLTPIAGFPVPATIKDVPEALRALAAAVVDGEITSDEANALGGILEKFVMAVESVELASRLEAIEKAQEEARATTLGR